MTRFLLIRHAATDAVGKRLSGRMAGIHLNEEGQQQAELMAEWLADVPLAAVYSSPLERAMETALPLAKKRVLQVETDAAFIELDFGEWTNFEIDELELQPAFALFNKFRSVHGVPGGEDMLQAQHRFVQRMQQLSEKHPGQTIAIVSHSDMIRSALAHYAGIHIDLFQRLEISPAAVSVVEVYEETVRIQMINAQHVLRF